MSDKTHIAELKLSIRRSEYFYLPGDDPSVHNLKIGASINGNAPLRGLSFEECRQYLPSIIGTSPNDNNWNMVERNYWNDISVPVPADGMTASKYQGKVLRFLVEFKSDKDKRDFEAALDFEEKAELAKKGTVVDGISDFILFRYCLVYSLVANRVEDIGKTAKIRFYLYSPKNEILTEHKKFKARTQARAKFVDIMDDDKMVDAMLLMYAQDLSLYDTVEAKHIALEVLIEDNPTLFLQEVNDENIKYKVFIKKAVNNQIINKPQNTDSYYYGDSNEVTIGHSLNDAILYVKSDQVENQQIVQAIKARLNQ